MTDVQPNLAERVFQLVSGDYGTQAAADACSREPAPWRGGLSKREEDLREWGLLYGFAFGTAQAEEPNQDENVLAERALDAARAAYRRWSDDITARPALSPVVDAVLLAFAELDGKLGTVAYDHARELMPLNERLADLSDAVGVPAREPVIA